jgi:hypothetical protein
MTSSADAMSYSPDRYDAGARYKREVREGRFSPFLLLAALRFERWNGIQDIQIV